MSRASKISSFFPPGRRPKGGGQISADYERGRFAKVSLDNPGFSKLRNQIIQKKEGLWQKN